MGAAFGITEEDIMAAALRRGKSMTDEQASLWYGRLNHDAIELAALEAVGMEDQLELAMDAIESQLDELGCFDEQKAEAAADALSQATPQARGVRAKRM